MLSLGYRVRAERNDKNRRRSSSGKRRANSVGGSRQHFVLAAAALAGPNAVLMGQLAGSSNVGILPTLDSNGGMGMGMGKSKSAQFRRGSGKREENHRLEEYEGKKGQSVDLGEKVTPSHLPRNKQNNKQSHKARASTTEDQLRKDLSTGDNSPSATKAMARSQSAAFSHDVLSRARAQSGKTHKHQVYHPHYPGASANPVPIKSTIIHEEGQMSESVPLKQPSLMKKRTSRLTMSRTFSLKSFPSCIRKQDDSPTNSIEGERFTQ